MRFLLTLAVVLTASVASMASAQMMHGHGHGADGTGHDMVGMPGLRGVDATPQESGELRVMFHHFDEIERSVENLPNGIRTVTSSTNPMVMEALVSHVTGMIARVEEGRDPQVIIQSPTLTPIFAGRDDITSEIDITEEGIVVIQTSDNPDMVTLLQTHAEEVTDMADRGMQAVHERMMQ
ncbi:hypothetical protein [Tropicibacter naphthalenivorans]|nr:hypothetical protein [Tropicibacter naphthalenivorans]